MSQPKTARLSDLIGLLNQICPPALAEDWDNVGLQVGDPGAEIERVLVCLDAEQIAIDEARRRNAQLIISHHPLLFRPLKRISAADSSGQIIYHAIRSDIAIVSAHTNLDRAAEGLNDWLAQALGLSQIAVLENYRGETLYKLVTFVPVGHEQAVMEGLFAAGAGQIGEYDRVAFRTAGTGSFRGSDRSQAFIGTPGEKVETAEVRLETIVPAALLNKVVARLIRTHPYEEVAYDLIPLANHNVTTGLGRIGRLEQPLSLEDFAGQVADKLEVQGLRLVGDRQKQIRKVAVCGGSGMSTYADALRNGADCLVTGDIKFHEAQRARTDGMALIDAGHFATERLMICGLAQALKRELEQRQLAVDIMTMDTEEDPFVTWIR